MKYIPDSHKQLLSEWIATVQEWADRHKISLESALTIISDDSRYNQEDPDKPRPTLRSITSCVNSHEYAVEYLYGDGKPVNEET